MLRTAWHTMGMIICAVALSTLTVVGFSPERPWAVGFTDSSRISLAADVDGDGYADLISIAPSGDASIDVDISMDGVKAAGGSQGLDKWGKDCQAATAGLFAGDKQASVVGMFGGDSLNLASNYSKGRFQSTPAWVKLPRVLDKPRLALVDHGGALLAWSTTGGAAFKIDTKSRAVTQVSSPGRMVWIGDEGDKWVGQTANGEIDWIDAKTLRSVGKLGQESKDSLPAAADGVVAFGDKLWTPAGVSNLPADLYPKADVVRAIAPADPTGRLLLVDYRKSGDFHRGDVVLVQRSMAAADATQEDDFKDSSNDGLLDVWKLNGFRGIDLKAMGCTPGHADVICLVSKFEGVNKALFDGDMKRVIKFYADLPVKNPDGTTGIRFHPIYLDEVKGKDKENPWQTNRDKFLPEKWRGVVHWMQVTTGGGGQADELSNGGTCGEGALWAVFVHEFGHQLGLNHEGFWPVVASPIYTSLMNYTWSYGFEDDRNKIHYSNGEFSNFTMKQSDLDETLPFPYEKVKFLSDGPYHFRMKPDGPNKTLIDWNWNGVFGEKHVKANITYAYSTTAGDRDECTKFDKTAPWLFAHQNKMFVMYGANNAPVDLKRQPTLDATNPGRLCLRRMIKPSVWSPELVLNVKGLIGDPVAVSYGGQIICSYPTDHGLMASRVTVQDAGATLENPVKISEDTTLLPTIGVYDNRCYLFDWNPKTHEVGYRLLKADGTPGTRMVLDVPSSNPVGLCADTIAHEAIIGLAQDQDKGRINRWQARRYRTAKDGSFVADGGPLWVEGEAGGARGTGRITVLFGAGRQEGPKGRIYIFSKGMTDDKNPWACSYVAEQIADPSYHGGWLVKRYYDEWTQTRSAPSAAWFGKEMFFAYRWTDGGQGEGDNRLQVGYNALGIDDRTMGDFDDLSYIRNFGLANSLSNLSRAPAN